MMMKVQKLPRESNREYQFSTLIKEGDSKEVNEGCAVMKGVLSRCGQQNKGNVNKLAKKESDAVQTRNKIKLPSSTARSHNKKRSSLEQILKNNKQSIPALFKQNIKKLQQNETQLINLIQSGNVKQKRLLNNNSITTSSRTPGQKSNIQKVHDKNFLKQISQRLRNDVKTPVQDKSNNTETPLARETFRKTLKITGPPPQSLVETKNKIQQTPSGLQKGQEKQKNEVKFNQSLETSRQPSFTPIRTPLGSESRRKQLKKRTLRFQLPYQLQNPPNNKPQKLIDFHQKLFQNKQNLQKHIRTCLSKLNSKPKNHHQSLISLNEIKTERVDVTLRMDQVLEDINSMLESLKVLKCFDEGSFHREILIRAKLSVYERVKSKARYQKSAQILQQLLEDISLIKPPSKRTQLKKQTLYQLSSIYFLMKQYKKSITTYSQLARLGDPLCYLKAGQISMLTKQYQNSIRYHEKYASQMKFNLHSKVKLAYAYSKVPQYYLKTMDMLTSLLIAPGYSSKFKPTVSQVKPGDDERMIQSAVILLSSLYFKNDNVEKAIELCQSYSKINIKNYRVLHLLGGYYRFEKNQKKAFHCYLNALENEPSHHKSLIELTEFICYGTEYKTNAIKLLRKCFSLQKRNFELLTTLIKFLKQDKDNKKTTQGLLQQKPQKPQVNYKTLLQYAQILKHSQSTGYWDRSLYQQATIVYEWALSLLQNNCPFENLSQIEQIYRDLGEICLKQGDYMKSERYYKLYLIQIQKHVNNSTLIQKKRQEKIQIAKIEIYFFLGKVKKHQHQYKKAINYFTKSHALQLKYHVKLEHFQGYFYFFQVGYCYFLLQNYSLAIENFLQQKSALLTLISIQDRSFFNDQLKSIAEIPAYLMIEQVPVQMGKKVNYLKGMKFDQNQTSQNLPLQQQNHQPQQIGNVLKRNYLENDLHLAFCYDKMGKFIQSKEIYKRILQYFKEAVNFMKKKSKQRKEKNKKQQKQSQDIRQSFFKCIINSDSQLNPDFTAMKKVCLLNLATIYKLQGIQNKYQKLTSQCLQLCPLDFQCHWSMEHQKHSSNEQTSNDQEVQSIVQEKLECTIKRMTMSGYGDEKGMECSHCFSL